MTRRISIADFLPCETPDAWIEEALKHPELLLIDHANCEKKAANTALNLMFRYTERTGLLKKMSRLAREELRHFEQVLAFMIRRGVDYVHIGPSRYAEGLRKHLRKAEPGRLIDILIIGAYIEARSCERFEKLAPYLDEELGNFYRSLLRSESRHFTDYLGLARGYAGEPIDKRLAFFAEIEKALILEPDDELRFHSGPPAVTAG
ncbi:MAG: tRNA-(ms[2]io[6]A)-hydroxylase [Acidobacteriota bacterium]|nr:tRNA-(ms[2]io[6]A)-hydroxylase [Acidobacteriota bacterium]